VLLDGACIGKIIDPRTKEGFDWGSEVKGYRLGCEGSDSSSLRSRAGIGSRIFAWFSRGYWENAWNRVNPFEVAWVVISITE